MRKLSIIFGLIFVSCQTPQPDKLKHLPPRLKVELKEDGPCPGGMKLISGSFCKNPTEDCEKWLDPEGSIVRRCAKYKPSKCSSTISRSFCMDVEEFTGDSKDKKPKTDISWTEAKNICASNSKRLCSEDEWTSACEGTQTLPYPYGFERRADWCNIDKMDLVSDKGEFIDKLDPISSNPKCSSPFGIHNMTGNADEFVTCSHGNYPFRSCEMGGWWGPVRNRCRAVTYGHDEFFHEIQIGFRCCADPSH